MEEELKSSMEKVLQESNNPAVPESVQNSLKELYQDYARAWNSEVESK